MDNRTELLETNIVRSARSRERIVSIMESQSLSCFILFYLREGNQVLANTHDHVLRTIKQGYLDDYDDDDEYDMLL